MKARSLIFVVGLVACRQPPPVDSVTSTSAASIELAPSARQPGGCEALIDVESPDTLRLARADGTVVLYANEQVGLAIVDVSDPDRPTMRGVSELVGVPAGVFDIRGVALVVYETSDQPAKTVVRAIAYDGSVRTLGEQAFPGRVRDARRVGDFLVITWETADGNTAVTSYGVAEHGPAVRSQVVLDGRAAVTDASPHGIAVARAAVGERTTVTWLALDPDFGALTIKGSATFDGVVPAWRSSQRVIDVTEDDLARLVTCATAACDAAGPAVYAAIDFSTPNAPRVTSRSLVPGAGDGVIGFQGTGLVVGRSTADRSDASEVDFYRTETTLTHVGRVHLRGSVGSIAVRDSGDIVTIGWTGSASSGKRAILHHIDARAFPRLVGAATFGGDWTWSRAYDDDRIIAFDPLSTLAALPITTVRGRLGPKSAVQVFSLRGTDPRAFEEESTSLADRLLFVNGRLLAFSADGVAVLHRHGEWGRAEPWNQLPR